MSTAIVSIFLTALILTSHSPMVSQSRAASADPCSEAKNIYILTEKEWSSINADVGLTRVEIEKLRNLRWDIKTTLSVMDDAIHMMKQSKSLSPAQSLTLNARIPQKIGMIHPDGTFSMNGLQIAPLPIKEAKEKLRHLLSQSEADGEKKEIQLKDEEQKSHRLSRKLTKLEKTIEKKCSISGTQTPWEKGLPRVSKQEIYQRYADRERLRQKEVESRYTSDLERLWLQRYSPSLYSSHLFSPGSLFPGSPDEPLAHSRALLIELKKLGQS